MFVFESTSVNMNILPGAFFVLVLAICLNQIDPSIRAENNKIIIEHNTFIINNKAIDLFFIFQIINSFVNLFLIF